MVRVDDRDGVRVVTFDRPERLNAFDTPTYHAVASALADALDDEAVRVVVMTGAGRAFCAGQDLDELAALADGTAPEGTGTGFVALLDVLVRFDKPLLAAVNGVAVGIGATMLAHCDVVVMATDARLRTPFAELGVPPEGASSLLFPARLGWQQAARLLLASDWLSAQEAVDAGLALKACDAAEVVDETVAIAARMAAHSPAAVRTIKRLMLDGQRDAVGAAREREEAAFAALFS
ncbi:MAG TPA: enoyl-CoA hydratase-related protein [Acidimicrobiia bacterium]|nr:enoyl-CoA hydratase-related protein [Acidimicrobiia bacterium]